jgi:hypothetical protein
VEVALLFLNLGNRRGCGQHHSPAAFTAGKEPVPIVQEAGWAPEPICIGAENLAPPGFNPGTFQPVASRYTDYAIPAPKFHIEKPQILEAAIQNLLAKATCGPGFFWHPCLEM